MPIPVLHRLRSIELEPPALPADPADCAVLVHAEIGPANGPGTELFTFSVVTPSRLLTDEGPRWGRGYLVVPAFDWSAVERAVRKLLMHADRDDWSAVAGELAKEMHWEFEGYSA